MVLDFLQDWRGIYHGVVTGLLPVGEATGSC